MDFSSYKTEGFFDEIFEESGAPRPYISQFVDKLASTPYSELQAIQKAAETSFFKLGITFNVYGNKAGTEKIFPFDIIPRIIPAREWQHIEKGLKQRITALNCFLQDVYNDQKIIKDNVIPADIIFSSPGYLKACQGLSPQKEIWCHVSGTDIVHDKQGQYFVLEDNVRCPSGVSYVLENRQIMKETFPSAFKAMKVRPVEDYPQHLHNMLEWITPQTGHDTEPTVVLLTPGTYNSAYFEHAFLAQKMGITLVEGNDLFVEDDKVYMLTTRGPKQVDVIYRRVDDLFLDPCTFHKDSLLGVPGIMSAYKKGNIALANAPGTGIADDKAIYRYVEAMIRYYLGEQPIIANVPTYICANQKEREKVIANIDDMVVKPTNASGGYGIMIGSKASKKEKEACIEAINLNPREFIAQPIVALSRVPVLTDNNYEGRHVDLRPYTICGEDFNIIPGGLTRVALEKDSLIVNSSQGGGSKDTWVLAEDIEDSYA